MANVRSKNEERLLQRDNLPYYGATIIPSEPSLQVRTPPDGCESDTLSRDRKLTSVLSILLQSASSDPITEKKKKSFLNRAAK